MSMPVGRCDMQIIHNRAGGLASRHHERGVHKLSSGVSRLISISAPPASTALDVARHFCSASRAKPLQNQIAAFYGTAEVDYRRASSTLPAPNIRQQPSAELLRYSLPEALRLVSKASRRRVAGCNSPQFRSWSILHRSISNVSFSYSAANTLQDVEFVGVDHLDLGLIANECCNAEIGQRRA